MQVLFATAELQRCFEQYDSAVKQWGQDVGRKYIQRVKLLLAANTLADLAVPRSLHLHPLKGDRAGQHAISLNDRWRLIFTYSKEDGTARIEEVTNHYDD